MSYKFFHVCFYAIFKIIKECPFESSIVSIKVFHTRLKYSQQHDPM